MTNNTDTLYARLVELLVYNPQTGIFTQRVSRGPVRIGDIAGTGNGKGYVKIRVGGKKYAAHRLAFLYMTGKWPTEDVDHINNDPSDNRWANLREATTSQNIANSSISCRNTSGFKGVTFDKESGKWMAQIRKDKKRLNIGRFSDKFAAANAYKAAAVKLFGEYAKP